MRQEALLGISGLTDSEFTSQSMTVGRESLIKDEKLPGIVLVP